MGQQPADPGRLFRSEGRPLSRTYRSRAALAQATLFFAGEAAWPDYPALCSGACITGETAVAEVLASLS